VVILTLETSMGELPSQWRLEPVARSFIESLDVAGVAPIHALPPREARAMLVELQAGPIGRPNARVENVTFPLGPGGFARACIVRPLAGGDSLPAVMYFHGGGWVLGDVHTHERLIREISVGTRAAVVFVEMSRAPEAQYPVAIEEAYGATRYVADYGASLNVDGSRLAVAGDGTGGNVAAAVTLMAKERRGPKITLQVLLYPVTDSNFASGSYTAFRDGPWLTQQTMKWFWDAYLPNAASRALVTASPLKATLDQLWGLPEALVITAENDVLREEGEAYACKLAAAGARVTATRYIGTIHDFVMLNALADSPPTRGAIEQITARLRTALE
jgi:acetyl esterase